MLGPFCLLTSLLVTLFTPGGCQTVFSSSPLFGQPAAIPAEKRLGPFNAIANNLSGLDIKGKLNEIYDKYKGPLFGKGNDPNNYGQIIAEISATQPGTSKGGTYTVPGSGITHVTSDKGEVTSITQDASQVAESKGSIPIGGRPDDLATSSSRHQRATASPDKNPRAARGTRNTRNRRDRRQRDRDHPHRDHPRHRNRDHHHHHHHPDSHRDREYHNAYRNYGSYDPYYPTSSNSVYSRYQPHLPPLPPHPSILTSPFLNQQALSYTNVPPSIIGVSAGASAAAAASSSSSSSSSSDSSARSPSASSPSAPAINSAASGQIMSNPLGPIMNPLAPFASSPYSNLAALSALPPHQINPLINALLLNHLALASVTTTTASPIATSTKKSKSKKSSKKSSSNSKNLALTTSINTEDGTISIGGIDPEHVIRLVGGVVQSTGLNKALGSALSTVMTTVSKVGTQVVKQAVHSISDSVTLSLNHPHQSPAARASGKRRKSVVPSISNAQRISQIFKFTNPLIDSASDAGESNGHIEESESIAEETSQDQLAEPADETIKEEVAEEEETEERVKRDKAAEEMQEAESERSVQQVRRRKKQQVNRIRINRLKPGQMKSDPAARTLKVGGTNISLKNTDKGGFSISIGDSGDRRKDQGFVRSSQTEQEESSSVTSSVASAS